MHRPLAKLGSTTAFVALALVLSTAAAGNGQAVTALADLSSRRGIQAEAEHEPSAHLWTCLSEAARHLHDGGCPMALADLGRSFEPQTCQLPGSVEMPDRPSVQHLLRALPQLTHLPPPVASL